MNFYDSREHEFQFFFLEMSIFHDFSWPNSVKSWLSWHLWESLFFMTPKSFFMTIHTRGHPDLWYQYYSSLIIIIKDIHKEINSSHRYLWYYHIKKKYHKLKNNIFINYYFLWKKKYHSPLLSPLPAPARLPVGSSWNYSHLLKLLT